MPSPLFTSCAPPAGNVVVAEQMRQRYAERLRDARQRVQAGRRLAVLDLGQHAAADAGLRRDVGDGQMVLGRSSRMTLPR